MLGDIRKRLYRVLENDEFFKEHFNKVSSLTKREKEILKYMAISLNSGNIGEKLFISSATVDTHRRNIRNKLGLKNNYDAVKFAQAYNLI